MLQHTGGLKPETAYRYRVVATNTDGATTGPDPAAHHPRSRPGLLAARRPRLGDGLPGRQERRRDPELRRQLRRRRDPGRRPGRRDHLQLAVLLRRPARGARRQPVPLDARRARLGRPRTSPCRCSRAAIPKRPTAASPTSSSPTDLAARPGQQRPPLPRPRPAATARSQTRRWPDPAPRPATATTTCATARTAPSAALLTSADLAHLALGAEDFELAFAGATPDLAHIVLSTCAALTADATEVAGPEGECDADQAEPLREVGRGPGADQLLPATPRHPARPSPPRAGRSPTDGSRVYWTDGTQPLPARRRRRPRSTSRRGRRDLPDRQPRRLGRLLHQRQATSTATSRDRGRHRPDPARRRRRRARRLRRRHLRLLP